MARRYYYDTGKNKIGPVTGADLLQLRAEGEIDGDTWVRREDSATWRPLSRTDLSREEEEENNPGFWALLRRILPLRYIIFLTLALLALLALAVGLLSVAWPFFLGLFLFWLILRAMK